MTAQLKLLHLAEHAIMALTTYQLKMHLSS